MLSHDQSLSNTFCTKIGAVTKIPNIFIFLEADVFGGWLGSGVGPPYTLKNFP